MQIIKIGIMVVITCAIMTHFSNYLVNPVSAQAVWEKGVVTKVPWKDRHYRIEIDGITFTFMPEIGVWFSNMSRPKVSGDERAPFLQRIPAKQKVRYKVQGHRIYEIMIEE